MSATTPAKNRVSMGVLFVYLSFFPMVAYAIGAHQLDVARSGAAVMAYAGLLLGLAAEAFGLFLVYRGIQSRHGAALPAMIAFGAAVAAFGIGVIDLLLYLPTTDIPRNLSFYAMETSIPYAWVLLEPASLQRVCFGLSLFAVVRAAAAGGHQFRRKGGADILSVAGLLAAASILVLRDPIHHAVFFIAQPMFGLVFLVLRQSLKG